ncbi:MAG TPA: lipopolysaccharide heptosyltransferase II [bacterium]|nr:lipopolysaccharide heptosyltransferase II [bacterium]
MKILIFTKNWLGDILFQFPAIQAIHDAYPEAEIVCVAPERCHEILTAHPAVNRVISFDEKKGQRFFFSRVVFGLKLRREKWDKAYLLHRSRTRAFMAFLAGARERIGYAFRRKRFLTKAIAEPAAPMHHVDYALNLIRTAGIPCPENAVYRFNVSEKARASARKLLEESHLQEKGFVCFHLGANWEPKRWPVKHFARLADLLHEKWQVPVVVTGAREDQPLVHELAESIQKARLISLAGRTGLSELAAVYAGSCCLVTGDSGPMHIASGVGTPVVALFGPTDPNLTGPRGAGDELVLQHIPVGYSVPWYGKKLPAEGWLSKIEPETVMTAIEKKGWIRGGEGTQEARDKRHATSEGIKNHSDKNILFVTLSNIGDVIVTTPVLMALAARFPDAKLTAVVGPRAKEVLTGSRFIHELVVYDKKASLRDKRQFLKTLRRKKYEWVIDLRNSAIPYLVSTRQRTSFIRRAQSRHIREKHLELLEKTGLKPAAIPSFDFFGPKDEQTLSEKLAAKGVPFQKKWIAAAPVAASQLKTWRLAGFKEVIGKLLEARDESILLVGDHREREALEPFQKSNPDRVFNFAGETTLRELAALLSKASLVIANDSAVMHLGFELKRPVVGIFGPTNHEKSGYQSSRFRIVREPVFCSPCEKPRCRFERQHCFEDLKTEKVFEACMELLKTQEPPSVLEVSHARSS